MKKYLFIQLIFLTLFLNMHAQDSSTVQPAVVKEASVNANEVIERTGQVYTIKKGVDIPVFLIAGGWSGYAFTKIYSKDPSTDAQIENLNRNDVSSFNRSAIDHFNQNSKKMGDAIFYGSMPLPLFLLLDKKIRTDAGKVGFLWLETMSITGLLYTSSVYFHDKYRPYAYNPQVAMDHRKRGGAKNSFYAGHVALVGSSTFFIAKVYADYHPNSGFNWILYTLAAGATGTVAYLRYDAGEHFPTDIIIGTTLGTLTGILVPHFHKNKPVKTRGLTLLPMVGESYGFSARYKF